MFLQPKKTKYKKNRKGTLKKIEYGANKLKFGTIGLKALESGCISAKQIESARQAINRRLKRNGKIWIRIFPHISVTAKPIEVRMGKGKGSVKHWISKVKRGSVLFEIDGVSYNLAKTAFKTGGAKLPIKTIIK
tara:strand:- start:1897 stop:2298 length:402 start_codon:yes stop_codon:yes gene_type:complete